MYYYVYCTSISTVGKIIEILKSDMIKKILIYYKKSNNLFNIRNTTSIEFEKKKYIPNHLNYTISTLKTSHLYHNVANIKISINNKIDLKDNRYTCFLVFQPINEDIYFEKHETLKYLSKKPVKINNIRNSKFTSVSLSIKNCLLISVNSINFTSHFVKKQS